ncbi:MAG: GNAT family N-acetyltransferase, partial [Dehalococcoidia bacterium]
MTEPRPVKTVAPAGLRLRWLEERDMPFLAALYASTRAEELSPVPWTAEQKAAFLQWQFASQHSYYQEYYPTCEFLVVEVEAEGGPVAVGRLYL